MQPIGGLEKAEKSSKTLLFFVVILHSFLLVILDDYQYTTWRGSFVEPKNRDN